MGQVASPPTARALDVLELLAREGSCRFTDVVRELDLTQATAHAILGTLEDRGWVTRDADKTFTLGEAASLFARHLGAEETLLQRARAATLALVEETGYAASVVERVGDSLVISAFELPPPAVDTEVRGATFPFAAPFGGGFAAWESDEGRRAWIARSVTGDADLAQRLLASLDRSVERGYDLDWSSPALARLATYAGPLRTSDESSAIGRVIADLLAEIAAAHVADDDVAARSVTTISAPVLDRTGRVALNLGVHPGRRLGQRQIEVLGRRVARAAAAISPASEGEPA